MAEPANLPEWDDETMTALMTAWQTLSATGYGVITLEIKDGQLTNWDVRITGKCKREKAGEKCS